MRIHKKLYLEIAAKESKDDMDLWLRYLSKYITNDFNKITTNMYNTLQNSKLLNKEQKMMLKESMTNGTYANIKVRSMSQTQTTTTSINESSSTPITDKAFKLLNDKLRENNLTLEITCAGGFVLQILGIRATMDVDAFFIASSKINSIIEEVGNELDINEEDEIWLNNSIANLNAEPEDKFKEIYKTYSNLNIYIVQPKYLIGMKIKSGREKDFKDASLLIKKLDIKDPILFRKELNSMGFKRLDFADVLACFGDAYGHRWLANLYKDNSDLLFKYL
jgi:hypothetical protein